MLMSELTVFCPRVSAAFDSCARVKCVPSHDLCLETKLNTKSRNCKHCRYRMSETLDIKVEFGGGTELLFDKQKQLSLQLIEGPDDWTIKRLIGYLCEHHIKERVELFASGEKIRPGILVLVNDVDYEILGGDKYKLKQNDTILFISTLHGG